MSACLGTKTDMPRYVIKTRDTESSTQPKRNKCRRSGGIFLENSRNYRYIVTDGRGSVTEGMKAADLGVIGYKSQEINVIRKLAQQVASFYFSYNIAHTYKRTHMYSHTHADINVEGHSHTHTHTRAM